ncbi:hypothetical protein L195_g046644 [Trifolium pratense]|uniref:Uncharacterized protein n=1 Tax=Trifolium pratense TaxID=57577 RepID=A0A2K3MI95_TRIPR|nr:hypothetical protein L195_g046644 [Trifolium pratense]
MSLEQATKQRVTLIKTSSLLSSSAQQRAAFSLYIISPRHRYEQQHFSSLSPRYSNEQLFNPTQHLLVGDMSNTLPRKHNYEQNSKHPRKVNSSKTLQALATSKALTSTFLVHICSREVARKFPSALWAHN